MCAKDGLAQAMCAVAGYVSSVALWHSVEVEDPIHSSPYIIVWATMRDPNDFISTKGPPGTHTKRGYVGAVGR